MTNTTPFEKPEFIFGPETAVSSLILVEDIFARPEAYRTALAASSVLMNAEVETEEHIVDGDVIKRLQGFFEYRHDRDVDFDPDTEDALTQDPDHMKLLEDFRVNNDQLKLSTAKRNTNSNFESDAKANLLRDRIRQHRLGFFVGRVITWKELSEGTDKDRLHRVS